VQCACCSMPVHALIITDCRLTLTRTFFFCLRGGADWLAAVSRSRSRTPLGASLPADQLSPPAAQISPRAPVRSSDRARSSAAGAYSKERNGGECGRCNRLRGWRDSGSAAAAVRTDAAAAEPRRPARQPPSRRRCMRTR
jgi:hypothetical protein